MAEPRAARTFAASRSVASVAINGEPRDVPVGCTVEALLVLLAVGTRRVAVAVNGEVVPRSNHSNTSLCEGDRVEVLEAVGGG